MRNDYTGPERRKHIQLSDIEFEAVARRAKEIAIEEIYSEIGKGVLKRLLWLLGLGGTGFVVYLTSKGYLK